MTPELAARLVKAYDIRGLSPQELDESAAHLLGAAFAELTGAPEVALARDMRDTSPALAEAFARGLREQGVDVVDAGLGSTDYLYFVSGRLGVPGAMFTASHNPAGYNGIKLCRAGAVPVGEGTGLEVLRAALTRPAPAPAAGRRGGRREVALLDDYAAHLHSLVDLSGLRPLKVVVDAGNGMAGLTVPLVLDQPALTVVPMYFELDGSFPNHEADPMKPANVAALKERVRAEGADLGLAFDGDADRCFAVDERGEAVPASSVVALVAKRLLAREPGAAVVHNLITSRGTVEQIEEAGGKPVRSRVGHSFVKRLMAEHQAVFGGEHSGHYYFRDFWFADTGLLAALHIIAELSAAQHPLSTLVDGLKRYESSGEVNLPTPDPAAAVVAVEHALGDAAAQLDHLDGLTASFADGSWFNVRPSNTEPVLRLNAEAGDPATLAALREQVLAAIARA
ncbi:phosphomannomutase/phosphoglucomutase [Streptomyces tateyamensis]|uniref:Phosphomannomutase/phosphoglucomutase n=1 Tax=Streptomyces tateyamensis TaxID=565073 RepID=A0A2V4P8Y6_9ACTN|nr:phosphomannomutase/phosphoglucomutase [Streptomyces tateyamensis]PYC86925.1 phosphomannomutase/phosphoglucomutase [Streptomyces tateyamensis]